MKRAIVNKLFFTAGGIILLILLRYFELVTLPWMLILAPLCIVLTLAIVAILGIIMMYTFSDKP